MASSIPRRKLRAIVSAVLASSERPRIIASDRRVLLPAPGSNCWTQIQARRRSFTFWKTEWSLSSGNLLHVNRRYKVCQADLLDVQAKTGYLGLTIRNREPETIACRRLDGKEIARRLVDYEPSKDVSDMIQRCKELPGGGPESLHELPSVSSSPSFHRLQLSFRRSWLRLESGVVSDDYSDLVGFHPIPDFFRTRKFSSSIDGTHRKMSTSLLLLAEHHSRRIVSKTDGRRYGNVFSLPRVVQSRLCTTSGQSTVPSTEKRRDDSRRQESSLVHSNDDTAKKTGIQKIVPAKLWPFAQLARLDKPIGTWLLAWPCFWSICMAAPSGCGPDPEMLGLFGFGAIVLRGAGCTVNDLWDRDIDVKVERTRHRPLASGSLTTFQGLSFLVCQLLVGLGVLIQLNNFSRLLGASSLLLVCTYPLMKRWTFWPQAFLGLTFNWGALLGWAAVHGSLDLSVALPLYAAGVCWSLVYDTIYAHQDKEDDLNIGVKSTAIRFGNRTQMWLTGFSAGCVGSLTLAGLNCSLGWPFYVGLAAASGHLAWQVSSVDIYNRMDCNSKFMSNKWFGAIVCSAIVLGKLAASPA